MSVSRPLRTSLLASVIVAACVNVNGVTDSETNATATTGDTASSDSTQGCDEGSAGCPCFGNATCDDGLECTAENVCVPEGCMDGSDGCPCYGNDTCDGDLVCSAKNICEPPSGDTSTTGDATTGGTTTGDATTNDVTTADSTSEPSTTSGSSGEVTGSTSNDTTGDVEPGCGEVPDDMACVPAATFTMGTDLAKLGSHDITSWEKPAHTVTISKTFWIDLTEVTVLNYAMCWAAQACSLPEQGEYLTWGVAGKENHPVNGVTWYQAKDYCEWKGRRLPTEAEWELAARGVDERMYPWGNDEPTCDHAVVKDCGEPVGTLAVGSKPLGDSPYGVHDMAGNVAEWTSDYFKEDYYYESPELDPMGPMTGTDRTARGIGVFLQPVTPALRVTYRDGRSPIGVNWNPPVAGFRCAQTAQ